MARPRHRVWIARLIGAGLITCIGVLAAGAWIWQTYFAAAKPAQTKIPQAWVSPPTARSASHVAPGQSESLDTSTRHPLDPILHRAREALAYHRREHVDFTATLVKRERIHGKLVPESRMQLKLRYRPTAVPTPAAGNSSVAAPSNPQSAAPPVHAARDATPGGAITESTLEPISRPVDVYLKFLSPASTAGREVIWRQGENDDHLILHEAGFLNLTRVHLAPTSGLAMMGNRYPITDIGLEKLLEKLIEKGQRDRELGDCVVRVTDDIEIDGQPCQRIEILHPEPTVTIAGEKIAFDFYRAIIDIDPLRNVPLHYASYRWPKPGGEPELEEEYTYLDLKLNCGLSDQDFDPENSDYHYP